MTRMSKSKSQRKHAKRRALERFGIDLNRQRRLEIIAGIQAGKYPHLEKQSNRVSVFLVDGARVVYDRMRKELVTFLPSEASEEPC